jgi:hypothetical protein
MSASFGVNPTHSFLAEAPMSSRRSASSRGILTIALLVLAACSELPTESESTSPSLPPEAAALLVSVAPPFVGCVDGTLPSGALSRICFPPDWNGDAIFWAHGYVSVLEPVAIPDDEIGGQSIQNIALGLRFAYATTSYRANGLVAVDAVEDLTQLASALGTAAGGALRLKYLIGASEGGLATALALERNSPPYNGGLIACAPVGSFRGQVNYFGDVRVLFDAFFPGVLPGSPIQIPSTLMTSWENVFEPAVRAALLASPSRTAQLVKVGRIAVNPADPTSAIESIVDAIWYNVFATNDARAKLGGGNPYDNRLRWYTGSANDFVLNFTVRRFSADALALAALQPFEASGALRRPAQMTHTRFDPVIPFWQAQLYQVEGLLGSGFSLLSVPSDNYGHCAFDVDQVLASFAILVLRVTGANLLASTSVFPDHRALADFERLATAGGADPVVVTERDLSAALSARRR